MSYPPGGQNKADRELAAILHVVEQLGPALRTKDRARQGHIVRQLINMRAPMGDQWHALADMMIRNSEIALARGAAEMLVREQNGAPMAQCIKAMVIDQCGESREAYDIWRSLPPVVPDRPSYAYNRATVALALGEIADAREQIEQALLAQPQMGQAWLVLALVSDLGGEPGLIERILAAERHLERAAPAQRGPYYYALGQALAQRGDHAGAFAAFERAGREMQAAFPYNRDADRRQAEAGMSGYDPKRIAAIASKQTEPTGRAMFVTGTPRSGTTLVEQILASHSAVATAGEANLLMQLPREMRGASGDVVEQYVNANGTAPITDLWHRLLTERVPGTDRVVIKALDTPRFAGLAAALLPDAPIIWLTRDPLDRAWSCFRNCFHGYQSWNGNLENIAFHFRLEDELLRHWQGIIGERLLVVPFEGLVDDPADWIPRITAHCGLTEEQQMFTPHMRGAAVKSASVMQVRRPINRNGVGVAEPYRAFLEPFLRAYER